MTDYLEWPVQLCSMPWKVLTLRKLEYQLGLSWDSALELNSEECCSDILIIGVMNAKGKQDKMGNLCKNHRKDFKSLEEKNTQTRTAIKPLCC